MFPLWDVAIAPVLEAAGAKRVVEIGALRGETTVRMLERLGADAELHVIDPEPDFDPSAHERQFPGRYILHEALSLDVLPTLGPMDAALIDGDHNWYTVYHELRLLAAAAREGGKPLPVLVLHDVLWPYGRRDLYYDPATIPEEHRQPHAQRGMRPGTSELLAAGGLNPTMWNALHEGGPANGVMTALEDFMAAHDRPLRRVVLPIYFGLAIVVEEERLLRQPALAAALDHLEGAEGRGELLEVSEEVRLRAMIFQHNVFFQRSTQLERATRRHLDVLKGALLNEHYLEDEVRLAHFASRLATGQDPDPEVLRDPARRDPEQWRRLARLRRGPTGPDRSSADSFVPYTAMGRPQLDHLERCLDAVRSDPIPGDLLECGTGHGGGAIFFRAYLDAHELPDRHVWVADPFRSTPEPLQAPTLPAAGVAGFQADLNLVRDGFERFGLLDDRVRFLQGPLVDALASDVPGELALLRVGRSAAGDVGMVLATLYDRVAVGGFVVVDTGGTAEGRSALEAFRADRGIRSPLEPVDATTVSWRRAASDAVAPQMATGSARGGGVPLAPPAPTAAVDLSVVVVFYDMRREAARTLHSLSRAYQEGIDDLSYEVIVVENGSRPDQRLGPELVAGFGPEFRYLDMGADADPSPVKALNRGIRDARGRAFALMIDGAHVLTPGVLHFGMTALATYRPAIVATQQWYIGPGQQGNAMDNGYDRAYEDRLFGAIGWPHAGYRLFDIGHFVGDRDWLDGLWESNCMFAERTLLEQVGGFDESFTMAGGGYANLDLYERLGSASDITVCSILGEGSFHQLHGGTTTNQPDAQERRSRVFGYGRHYADVRGRPFKGPGKPIHFVGRIMTSTAQRSKPRRLSTSAFAEGAAAGLHDGVPLEPIPVPDELRWAFTEAVWRNLPARRTTWLGRAIATTPSDLLAYQEILAAVRPDWVVESGSGDGGRALFLATVCELLGHGRVLSIGEVGAGDRPTHPRLDQVDGRGRDTETIDLVRATVGDPARAVVILGSQADLTTTLAEFEGYSPLVPVGSYVVITDTIVNGHPVWPAFGPGPAEAVKQILTARADFVPDPSMEKYSLSFNPDGFLRRIRELS